MRNLVPFSGVSLSSEINELCRLVPTIVKIMELWEIGVSKGDLI